ncbi:endolytic transglycosylase MltG [Porphyromonas pogonae]|uniref:endolytic transglycosylase MltG n=1 Tax=Porphyromonas pogonae TaxID=867595 RepID=UPI002E788208|nr:endolytic transglycosylase MltG [Porphyromonas pogonae]
MYRRRKKRDNYTFTMGPVTKRKRRVGHGWVWIPMIIILAGIMVGLAWFEFDRPAGHVSDTQYIYVRQGTPFDEVKKQIQKKVLLRHPSLFDWYADKKHLAQDMKPGRYAITNTMNISQIVDMFASGKQTPLSFTIRNIRTPQELSEKIGKEMEFGAQALAKLMDDSTYCSRMGFNKETIRCIFMPDTYKVLWTTPADSLMKMMHSHYKEFWNNERTTLADSIGFTPVQVMTIASIVEEESAHKEEYARIAGLYINRLHKNIPLQADPTIKYALGNFSLKRIMYDHLKTASPYNTYIYKGLPPAPIRLPRKSTIDTVLHYERHPYIYMCAKEDFSGSHNFAANFMEHQKNAKLYQEELNKRGIK